MRTSDNTLNSVDVSLAPTFDSVLAFVDETSTSETMAEDDEGVLLDDNGGTTGGRNKAVDEVMFNVVSALLLKSYNSVNKFILQYFFEAENYQRVAPK